MRQLQQVPLQDTGRQATPLLGPVLNIRLVFARCILWVDDALDKNRPVQEYV